MKVKGLMVGTAFLAACVVVSPTAHAAASCEWVTTDLPVPAGATFDNVFAASDSGEWVLGDGTNATFERGTFVWHNGVPTEEFHPEIGSTADVNNSGVLMLNGDNTAHRVKDGVRERLEPAAGKTTAWGENINNNGDVVGVSGHMSLYGPLVVWPAGSATPRELPGTRDGFVRFAKGMDDDGNVIGQEFVTENQRISRDWDRYGAMTRLGTLPGHYSAHAEVIRSGRIFGRSEPQDWQQPGAVVEWGLDGKIVRTFPEFHNVLDANTSGHVLGMMPAGGRNAVWRAPGQLDIAFDLWANVLADNGDVYGTEYDENHVGRPRHARCV
jgi:uncharacterized membrane protein